MQYLVRIYKPNADKLNVTKPTFEDCLTLLGKSLSDISLRQHWLNFEDVYFKGTKNYIRIIK